MIELNEGQLRALLPGWPRGTPVPLLERVRSIDRMMAPLVRGNRRWAEVPDVLTQAIDEAQSEFPEYRAPLWAYALDWLANAHEFSGEPASAICCLEARLRMRTPKNPWRANQYLTLVTLLQAEGQNAAARWYALRGIRHSRRQRSTDTEAALTRKLDQLK